jgi:hypothetical protein
MFGDQIERPGKGLAWNRTTGEANATCNRLPDSTQSNKGGETKGS